MHHPPKLPERSLLLKRKIQKQQPKEAGAGRGREEPALS